MKRRHDRQRKRNVELLLVELDHRADELEPAAVVVTLASRRLRDARAAQDRCGPPPRLSGRVGRAAARPARLRSRRSGDIRARRRRRTQRVQIGQELGNRLLARARLVPPRHVGDLHVLDQRRDSAAARRADRRPSCRRGTGRAAAERWVIDGLDQRRGALDRIGEVARHVGGVDVFDEQQHPGLLGQRRRRRASCRSRSARRPGAADARPAGTPAMAFSRRVPKRSAAATASRMLR